MPDYYLLSQKEVLEKVRSSANGLSSADARARLGVYGLNVLREVPPPSPLVILLRQFKSPIVWVLLVAMAVGLMVGETVDVAVIGVIVILNAVLGFTQEWRAERSIEALRKLVSQKAVVVRDGRLEEIAAKDVVPGDILVLEAGMKVAADAYLLDASDVRAQESALTGESVPVAKKVSVLGKECSVSERSNMVFAGTDVVAGRARAVVVGTGMQTEFGKIAHLLSGERDGETPLQGQLRRLSIQIGVVVGVVAVLIFAAGILKGGDFTVWLLTALALAVAAIPEGLPAVVTVGLSIGVQRMAKKNALIRHLPSAETLGACTVICADKTGTMTKNEMTVRKLFVNGQVVDVAGAGYEPAGAFSHSPKSFEMLLKIGVLNNTAQVAKEGGSWKVVGDPTEAALIVAARKAGLDSARIQEEYPKVAEVSFSSERKRMTTVHKVGKGTRGWRGMVCVKGAPEMVIGLCTRMEMNGRIVRLTKDEKEKLLEENARFARRALRVLAFAYKDIESPKDKAGWERDLVFVGLQAMIDPPRPEVKEAIAKCRSAGIRVVMITGDSALTAEAIGKEVGIEGRVVMGDELQSMDLVREVESIGIYARVDPKDKLRIVEALRKNGHVVAMTGDGVNDAPALKRADLGVAMGLAGTDVAREASAMVLADDNFASIVRAIEEGRQIFDNIQKYVAYLFSGNVAEVLVIVSSVLLGLPLPLIAIQILWINLVTDGLPALALSNEPLEGDVMQRKPRNPGASILSGLGPYVVVYPIIVIAGVLWLFDGYLGEGVEKARTVAFTGLVFFELFQAISCKSVRRPVFMTGMFRNKWLWVAVALSAALQVLIVQSSFLAGVFGVVSLSLGEWLLIAGVAFAGFAYLEVHKLLRR
ncbi:HAD family hydrolase [Candidatus Woesearchaeota archaeon]|nr:MAG: HAD family hydrolase [Candidatus Woesearchaeota archaeon]